MGTLATFKQQITTKKLLQEDYFKVHFGNLPTGIDENLNLAGGFDIWCQGTDLPGRSLSVLEVKKHNFTLRMPDRITYDGTWTVSVILDLSLTGYKALLKWQRYYSDFKTDMGGERGLPGATGTITLLDNNFNSNEEAKNPAAPPAGTFKIYGIFPSQVPSISMKQDSSNYLTPQVTFTYSWCDDFGDNNLEG